MTRTFVLLVALICATFGPASAQPAYPNRPIRIVVPFGAGGLADITMRLLGQKLSERTGAQIVIENRPSAGGIVAANAVITAAPDGYTLFVLSSGVVLSTALLKTMPFDPATAFAPISTVAFFDLLLLAKSDSPLHSTADMLAAAKANPNAFNIGTINPGSTQNIAAELLRSAVNIPMAIVAHRNTGDVLASLLRGDTQIGVESYAALKSPIDSGQIRAIAATGESRSPMQPNVPTLKEGGVNAVVLGWNALAAPAATPKDVVAYLNGQVRAVVESPDFKQRILDLGSEAKATTQDEFAALVASDVAKWAAVIKAANIEQR